MTYQQCGSLCVQTCDNPDTSSCPSGCAEGCFCPDGLIVLDGRCIDPIACPSKPACTCLYSVILYTYTHLYTYNTKLYLFQQQVALTWELNMKRV